MMQVKHKFLIVFIVAWFVFRTMAAGFIYRYMFVESILLLDAVAFIGVVYMLFERKKL